VAGVAATLFEMGCYEVSLGDTIGVGTPGKTRRMLDVVARRVPVEKLAGHYHDTYGQAVANIYASLEAGVAVFDARWRASVAAPTRGRPATWPPRTWCICSTASASKPASTLDALVDTAGWISERLGRPPASKVARAVLAKRAAACQG
jgi:hydroxymethylglutaryl-CoA lyase